MAEIEELAPPRPHSPTTGPARTVSDARMSDTLSALSDAAGRKSARLVEPVTPASLASAGVPSRHEGVTQWTRMRFSRAPHVAEQPKISTPTAADIYACLEGPCFSLVHSSFSAKTAAGCFLDFRGCKDECECLPQPTNRK